MPFEATEPVAMSLLGGAGATLKQANLSARIGVAVVGRCWRHFAATKPVSQDWGKVVVGRLAPR